MTEITVTNLLNKSGPRIMKLTLIVLFLLHTFTVAVAQTVAQFCFSLCSLGLGFPLFPTADMSLDFESL